MLLLLEVVFGVWQEVFGSLFILFALNHITDDGWMDGTETKTEPREETKKSLSKSNCYMIDRLLVIY